ncbi:MAG: anthrone oxygenase family protein [Pseudomonadota bacterium]
MISESAMAVSVSIAAVGAGLMAGIYFVFSTFVMQALQELPQIDAAKAMNAINRVILRSLFMPLFFGTTALYAWLLFVALQDHGSPGSSILFAAAFAYLSGMFLITLVFNVPLNNELARAEGNEDDLRKTWQLYTLVWVRWNHVRTLCSLLSALLSVYYLVTYA